jgi:hypothetical protein
VEKKAVESAKASVEQNIFSIELINKFKDLQSAIGTEESRLQELYGVSSEKSVYDNNNEQLAYPMDDPPGLIVVHEVGGDSIIQNEKSPRTKQKKSGEMSTRLPLNMPVEVVECVLTSDELKEYGEDMHPIGKELVRRELKVTPAKATIVEIWRTSYASRDDEANAVNIPIIKAPLPPQVIKGSMCSPETVAHIIVQKCVMGTPLYRQSQEWNRQGIPLTRQTMAAWLIRCSEDYFEPIYTELHRRLLLGSLIHSDDTTFQCLNEPGRTAQSQSRMWLYRTGSDAAFPIVLYDYQEDKKQERPREFLKGFSGYLTTDGSASYHNLPDNIILTGCFYHVRSKFDDALKCLKDTERTGSLALIGKQYCNQLFDIERDIKDISFDERYRVRREKAAPVLNILHAWLKSVEPYVAPKSKLGNAVGYALNQWKYLIRYLDDGRIECSNNRSERSIKPLVINRKNFLFADSVAGARAVAVMHSLTETAKESGLDPFRYLSHVLRTAAANDIRKDFELLIDLLPQNAPGFCRGPAP